MFVVARQIQRVGAAEGCLGGSRYSTLDGGVAGAKKLEAFPQTECHKPSAPHFHSLKIHIPIGVAAAMNKFVILGFLTELGISNVVLKRNSELEYDERLSSF